MRRLTLVCAAFAMMTFGASATELNVAYSPDFAEKLSEDLGEKEGARLTKRIKANLTDSIESGMFENVEKINITIVDAKPNRPTMKQLGAGGLSYASFSIGGISLEAEIIRLGQSEPQKVDYEWFSRDIRWAQSKSTWSDAYRASKKFVGQLEAALEG